MNISICKIPLVGKMFFEYLCKFEVFFKVRKFGKIYIQIYSDKIRQNIYMEKNIKIGKYSYGSCFDESFNIGGGSIVIGKYCSFANHVKYCGANHPMNMISMHPFFYNRNLFGFEVEDIQRENLVIGNGCWIGESVIITAGCKNIGNGAVVGAGSVVTKDVPAYAVVAGNPAKILKYRFEELQIKELEKTRWWEMKPEELYAFYPYFSSVDEFCHERV